MYFLGSLKPYKKYSVINLYKGSMNNLKDSQL